MNISSLSYRTLFLPVFSISFLALNQYVKLSTLESGTGKIWATVASIAMLDEHNSLEYFWNLHI